MALIGEMIVDGKKRPLPIDTEPADPPEFTTRLEVWSLENEMPRIFVKDYENISYSAISDFSADGSKIAVRLDRGRVTVIDINGDFVEKTFDYFDFFDIAFLAFSPWGNTLAIISDACKAFLWSFDTDQVNRILESDTCDYIAFSPDGLKLAARTESDLIKVYDGRANLVSSSYERAYNGIASDLVAFSPCGTMVASSPDYGSHVSIWDVSKRKVVHTELASATGDGFPNPGTHSVGFLGSKHLFDIVEGHLKVWNIQSGRLIHAYTTKMKDSWFDSCLAFSEGGSKLAVYDEHFNQLRIVDTKSGQSLVSRRLESGEEVITAKFSKDGSKLAFGIRNGSAGIVVELRETKSLDLKKRWTCRADQLVGQVAFSVDERFILFDASAPYTTVGDQSAERTFVAQTSAMTGQRVFISKDCRWILSPTGARMLYLPAELRPPKSESCIDGMVPPSASVHGSTVALGNETGHVTIMDFDFSGFGE
jgi:WD40 repeat protein